MATIGVRAATILIGMVSGLFAANVWPVQFSMDSSFYNHYGVAFGAGNFVVVGESGDILTYPDGLQWTNRLPGVNSRLLGVVWENNRFVAFGDYVILMSADGISWVVGTNNGVTVAEIDGVTFGDNKFIGISGRNILSSSDGVGWTSTNPGLGRTLLGITWGNNQYVAVGSEGAILTSPDGINWTVRENVTSWDFNSVTSGDSLFIAVGWSGIIYSSPDGITWIKRNSGATQDLISVSWVGNQYVAVGKDGAILSSPDGINWTTLTLQTWDERIAVLYGDLPLGKTGKILDLTRPLPVSIQQTAFGGIAFHNMQGPGKVVPSEVLSTMPSSIKVFDLRGRKVQGVPRSLAQVGSHRNQIPFHLPPGCYLISQNRGKATENRLIVAKKDY